MSQKPITRPKAPIPEAHEIPLLTKADWSAKYPQLVTYLTQTEWEDGKRRQTATLLFFVEGGRLRVCLNDRDCNRSCFLTVASMDDALEALENGLFEDTLTWRYRQQGSPGR